MRGFYFFKIFKSNLSSFALWKTSSFIILSVQSIYNLLLQLHEISNVQGNKSLIKVVLSGKTYLLTLIEVVVNISDEVVQAAASLALTLLKKLPNVCMEQDLIRQLVSNIRLNPVRPNVGSWCAFYKSRLFP